jgi:LysR family glycine cleavage system transcriptional activator
MALLERRNPGLDLTAEGRALLPELAASLDALGALDAHVRRAARQRTLRISASAALCNWWLIRRLPRFTALHPSIALEFVPREAAPATDKPVDLRISWVLANEARRTTTQTPLFREQVFPVCTPALRPAPSSPEALLSLPLIHKDADQTSEWSWDTWFRRLGLKRAAATGGGIRLGEIGLCLAAAAEGTGVALGRSLLVSDAIADGRLARLFPEGPVMESRKIYVARWPAELSADKDVQSFVRWLAEQAEQTCGAAV